jgi:hypothetical protein
VSSCAHILIKGKQLSQVMARVDVFTGGSLVGELLALSVGGSAVIAHGGVFAHSAEIKGVEVSAKKE